ncbi:MAG TPA: GNAT family N-acetyltransferase, partial [Thermoanaerobaculia bacterium]
MPDERRETIRPATETDIPRLATLFETVFGQRRDERIWRWKYFDPLRSSLSVVCEAAGTIVAHCGGVAVEFVDHGKRYAAYQLVDFMSTRAYAGGVGAGGIFVRTADWFFRHAREMGVKWVYWFPGERHRLVGQRLLGYPALEP